MEMGNLKRMLASCLLVFGIVGFLAPLQAAESKLPSLAESNALMQEQLLAQLEKTLKPTSLKYPLSLHAAHTVLSAALGIILEALEPTDGGAFIAAFDQVRKKSQLYGALNHLSLAIWGMSEHQLTYGRKLNFKKLGKAVYAILAITDKGCKTQVRLAVERGLDFEGPDTERATIAFREAEKVVWAEFAKNTHAIWIAANLKNFPSDKQIQKQIAKPRAPWPEEAQANVYLRDVFLSFFNALELSALLPKPEE